MTKGTTKRMIIMLLIAALVFGGIYGFQLFRNSMIQKAIKGQGMPPQAVSTIVAQMQTWQPSVEVVGNLRASSGANLAAEVSGLVSAIHFKSGARVKAGQVLVELNAAPQKAQLEQLKAAAALAQQNYQRDLAQLNVQAISQAAVDADASNLKSAQAQVAAQQAVIAQKTIRAPFSGRLGIRQVDMGQYVGPGTALVNLQKLDPMYLDFTVPQAQIDMIKVGEKITAYTNALPGKIFTGHIAAIEPQVDTATRNIKVRARFANPDGALLPGLFATARVGNGATQQYITLPNTAVAYNPYGSTVFIVKDAGKSKDGKAQLTVQQRFISTGLTRGDQVAVLTGLQAGETVVTAGQLKLHNGAPVIVNNSVPPSNNPNPEVKDE
ncbi:MexH family multidrug efflux RND transporter periplasmic adaptor subunit [Sulfuriferula plumbiphila]|uniref:MexH family multidrug efflux RND transporter periplasmic adaptor subunit n=1 Tax=Sulfuriferula plumbiphila TaxID=171865 RepID=A0A512L688_9PROT|nr:efflux RND transporter periplasmic adaptor subunit [Sulfuriferula plumbiphila]BBP03576.1 MexH family multidrug efflux RND transporter periplasmic adaptor subunit [Sulfuriferula plumbiphila]GEP29977.1 MexH family multidrug efflux RND transporter periplasmic adaptor subunit [Sulfuriferula plumbiphila]